MSKFTVAAIQAGSTLFDTEATLQQALAYITEAAEQSASLVVLPEAYLGGYPKGLDFGITVGSRTSQGRKDFQRYFDSAISVPGPETDALAEAANTHGLTIVIGVIERDGGTLVLHLAVLHPRRRVGGQAPQTRPHRGGALPLGPRGRIDAEDDRDSAGHGRVRDLLGELHAAAAPDHVFQRCRHLVRAHR